MSKKTVKVTLIPPSFGKNSQNSRTSTVYFLESIDGLSKIDIFPKDFIAPRGIQSNFQQRLRTTQSLQNCTLVVVPHEWQEIRQNRQYVRLLTDISQIKPILIFNTGDVSPTIKIKNITQIRTFLHPGEDPNAKIIIPYPIKSREFKLRSWSRVPRIGFMGQIPKISPGSLITRPTPNFLHPIKSSVYINRQIGVNKLRKLSKNVYTDVVVRPSFAALQKNTNFNIQSEEFQLQLLNCDYILCPRGFGNTSIRFYETLSAGRTPVLIDSDGRLPNLHNASKWEDHILSVGLFEDWERLILRDWNNLSLGDNYYHRQLSNLEIFNSVLNFDRYMEFLFFPYLKNEA